MEEDDIFNDFLEEKVENFEEEREEKGYDEEQELFRDTDKRLTDKDVNRISLLAAPDDMMLELMEFLTITEVVPDVGKYYTFIYQAKTPRIEYDQFPLIACVGVYKWGFRGLNYHWGAFRNYSWEEVPGLLHLVYESELKALRSIPYQNFTINN